MNLLHDIDQNFSARHMDADGGTLADQLEAGHMELIATLMKVHTQLVLSNYKPEIRTALVGPAHQAVMRSARVLAYAAAVATPWKAPE